MRRGSSGAIITPSDEYVTKRHLGSTRIADQGRWLQTNSSPAVPRVSRVYDESYVMERLAVPPLRLLDHQLVLRTMVNQLITHVWYRSAVAPLNQDMLQAKLETLIQTYQFGHIWPWVYRVHSAVNWKKIPACLTHGDPTFDNVMIRERTGELVLADPIPATLIVPDQRCVDVGKILQSVVGWEEVRYGTGMHRFCVKPAELHAHLTDLTDGWFDDNEWRASVFWCVVHLLRTLPYVDDTIRLGVRRLVGETLALA